MANVNNEKELGKALSRNEDSIEITGDLANKVIKIRATGKIAWIVAIGAIGVAVVGVLAAPASAGSTGLVSAAIAPVAVAILGGAVTYSAIAIAVAAGGINALSSLRKYKEISRTANSLILKLK